MGAISHFLLLVMQLMDAGVVSLFVKRLRLLVIQEHEVLARFATTLGCTIQLLYLHLQVSLHNTVADPLR
jgi:hypothetical protein